jgi:hypothetical protein
MPGVKSDLLDRFAVGGATRRGQLTHRVGATPSWIPG